MSKEVGSNKQWMDKVIQKYKEEIENTFKWNQRKESIPKCPEKNL